MIEVLADLRAQCVQYAALALQGLIEEESVTVSPLLIPVMNQSLPRGFLPELVARTYMNSEMFTKVFNFFMLIFSTVQYYSDIEKDNKCCCFFFI